VRYRSVPNIVYSTTRSWNCGDDFILFGIRRLVEAVLPEHNALIYNRHPELIAGRILHDHPLIQSVEGNQGPLNITFNPYELAKPFQGHWDNSVREGFDGGILTACIFAGTPEWLGGPVLPLVNLALSHRLPTAYLGVGSFEGTRGRQFEQVSHKDRELLRQALLVTVRDQSAADLLKSIGAERRSCPSLHAAQARLRRAHSPLRLALCLQGETSTNRQRIDSTTRDATAALFKELAKRCDCTLILHFADEFAELTPLLGDVLPIRYSYDPIDYFNLYSDFDMTVTTRVHGAGLCAALGIPAYVIGHSARSDTVEGFLARIIDPIKEQPELLAARIIATDVTAWSRAIIQHQAQDRLAMIERLVGFFTHIGLLPISNSATGRNSIDRDENGTEWRPR
jgi:hypothetical protein